METESVRLTYSDGAGTSEGAGSTYVTISSDNNISGSTAKVDQDLFKDADANPPLMSHYKTSLADIAQTQSNDHDFERSVVSGFAGAAAVKYGIETDKMNNSSNTYNGSQGGVPNGFLSDHSIAPRSQESQVFDSSSSQSISFQSTENNNFLKDPFHNSAFQLQAKISNASTLASSGMPSSYLNVFSFI